MPVKRYRIRHIGIKPATEYGIGAREWSAASYKDTLLVGGGLRGGGQSDWLRVLCLTLPILPLTEDVITTALTAALTLHVEGKWGSSEDSQRKNMLT